MAKLQRRYIPPFNPPDHSIAGMTIVEVLVAAGIAVVVMMGLGTLFQQMGKMSVGVRGDMDAITRRQEILKALEADLSGCSNFLQQAGTFNPLGNPGAHIDMGNKALILNGITPIQAGQTYFNSESQVVKIFFDVTGGQNGSPTQYTGAIRIQAKKTGTNYMGNPWIEHTFPVFFTVTGTGANTKVDQCKSFSGGSGSGNVDYQAVCTMLRGTYISGNPGLCDVYYLKKLGISDSIFDALDPSVGGMTPDMTLYTKGGIITSREIHTHLGLFMDPPDKYSGPTNGDVESSRIHFNTNNPQKTMTMSFTGIGSDNKSHFKWQTKSDPIGGSEAIIMSLDTKGNVTIGPQWVNQGGNMVDPFPNAYVMINRSIITRGGGIEIDSPADNTVDSHSGYLTFRSEMDPEKATYHVRIDGNGQLDFFPINYSLAEIGKVQVPLAFTHDGDLIIGEHNPNNRSLYVSMPMVYKDNRLTPPATIGNPAPGKVMTSLDSNGTVGWRNNAVEVDRVQWSTLNSCRTSGPCALAAFDPIPTGLANTAPNGDHLPDQIMNNNRACAEHCKKVATDPNVGTNNDHFSTGIMKYSRLDLSTSIGWLYCICFH